MIYQSEVLTQLIDTIYISWSWKFLDLKIYVTIWYFYRQIYSKLCCYYYEWIDIKLSSCIDTYGDEKECMHHHDLTIVLLYYSDCRSWFAVWDVAGGAAGAFGTPERDRTMWAGGQETAHLSGETTQRAATNRTAGQYRSTQKSCRTCCFTQVTYLHQPTVQSGLKEHFRH